MSDSAINTAVLVFAHYLGIDIDNEEELVYIAEEALNNLPPGWQLGLGDDENAGIPYFYNDETGESSWHHPQEKKYKRIVKEEKQYLAESRRKKADKQANKRNNDRYDQPSSVEKSDATQRESQNRSTEQNRTKNNGWNEAKGAYQQNPDKSISLKNKSNSRDDDDGVVEMLDVEDFDEEPITQSKSSPKTVGTATKATKQIIDQPATEAVTSAFTLSASDFFDEPTVQENPESHWNRVKETKINQSTQQTNSKSTQESSSIQEVKASNKINTVFDDERPPTGTSTQLTQQKASKATFSAPKSNDDRRSDSNPRSSSRGKYDSVNDKVNSDYSNNIDDDDRYRRTKTTSRPDNDVDVKKSSSRDANYRDDRSSSNPRSEKQSKSRDPSPVKEPSVSSVNVDYGSYVTTIAKLQQDLLNSQDENRTLQRVNKDLRSKFDEEIEALQKTNRKLDDALTEESDRRKLLEDKMTRLQQDHELKLRELDDESSSRFRDQNKKIRSDVEEEYKERIKTMEKRHQQELEDLSSDLIVAKKRHEEALREIEHQKKRIQASKEDGKLEIMTELEDTKQSLLSSEEKTRLLTGELKKLREDYLNVSSRLSSSIQQLQIITAENETSKLALNKAISESTATNQALVTATQRIASMDIDIANLRAEIVALRRDNDELLVQNRKLNSSSSLSGDKLSSVELENKRLKQQSLNEINRLNARIIELESINQQQLLSLDKQSNHETETIRELHRKLAKVEYMNSLYQERLTDKENDIAKEQTKLGRYEKQIQSYEEQIYKRDRQIHEMELIHQQLKDKYESMKLAYETEVGNGAQERRNHEDKVKDLEENYKKEMTKLHQEISNKLPALVTAAMQQIDGKWSHRLAVELSECKQSCELAMEQRYREKIDEYQSIAAEREAKLSKHINEEKFENDRLKRMIQALKQRLNEAEDELEYQQHMSRRQQRSLQSSGSMRESMNANDFDASEKPLRNSWNRNSFASYRASFQDNLKEDENDDIDETAVDAERISMDSKSYSAARNRVSKNENKINESMKSKDRVPLNIEEVMTMAIQSQLSGLREQLGRFINDKDQSRKSFDLSQTQFPSMSVNGIPNLTLSMNSPVKTSMQKDDLSVFQSPPINRSSYEVSDSLLLRQSSNVNVGRLNSDWIESVAPISAETRPETDDLSFEAIEDGGYHQGYWKAKYGTRL